ncbi:ATP-binding protein [Aerosakkonema funiforme]|uniref:ATP-binding protein n=1 Tax=Aerosakkonema funiforme TaxID=1246630 RepID=UPI0035B71F9F
MNREREALVGRQLLAGGGEMGALIRSYDWSPTKLGAIESWSGSLKTALSICLNSRFPMVIWWGKELILLYNDAWRPILGTKHPNSLGKPGEQIWSEIWDIIGAQLNSVLETGEATWSDDTLLLVDRFGYIEEAYFTYSYSPIFLESGEVGGAFTAVTETTQRVIGERRLSTLRELAANTAEAKSVEDTCRATCTTLANNPYDIPFALLYLVEGEGKQARLVGTTGIAAGTPASPERVDLTLGNDRWKLSQVQRTNEAQSIDDLTIQFGFLPGGAWEEPSRCAIALPIAQSGQKQHLAGLLVLGISPRREFDDKYRGFFDLVVSHVATAIADASAYEEEKKRAEALTELDRAKTVFFSNVSHEFRTPLTLMLGPLEDLLSEDEQSLRSNEREQLQTVHRNSLRLLKLVNTLLDFSRIEAGRIQAVYEPTDLSAFTAELASVFRSAIERAGMQLVVNCPPLPSPVYVDREMWEKILLNLLSNAFKFTLAGGITVALQWAEDRVELIVKDTGIGIPADEIPHLFERFHRVPGARGRTFEGSGIGLSLVQELVKLHGGEINVTSAVDRGTCFVVSIPIGTSHLPSDRISATRTLVSTATGAASYVEEALRWLPEDNFGLPILDFGLNKEDARSHNIESNQQPNNPKSKILLADDNADMRNYVKRLLSQQYEVETVADGLAALNAIRDRPPDLVLTDVMMPRLDGFELLRSLRTDPNTQDIPLILLSARAGEESRIEGLEAGADDYLIKPFSARELLARVEGTLKLSRLRQEAAQREQQLRVEAQTAQEDLENVLANINDLFYTLDRQWRYTYVNDRVLETVGLRREDLLGRSIWEIFPDLSGSRFETEVHRAVAQQTDVRFEFFYPSWHRWFESHIYPSSEGIALFVTDITARKQAEEALRQSEERFRISQELSLDAFTLLRSIRNEAGTIVDFEWIYVNPKAAEILKRSASQLTGQRLLEVLPGNKMNSELFERYVRVVETGEPHDIELCYEADGIIGWFRNMTVKLEDGIAISFNDITDRKQTEEALRKSEERARLAIRIGQLGIWRYDPTTNLVELDERMRQIWGESDDAIAIPLARVMERIHPDDREKVANAINAALAPNSSGTYDIDYRIVWDDGTERWVFANGQVQFEGEGLSRQPVGFLGTAINISDRKQAEESLRQSEERYRYLAESIPQLVWTANAEGVLLDLNQRWIDFTGLTLAQVQTEGWEAVIYPEDIAILDRNWAFAQQNGTYYQAEGRMRRVDGVYRWHLHQAVPLKNDRGQIVKWFGTATDIEDRKQLEQQRDRILQQEQAAREEAEQANRIKDEFLAVLSHELRSPLNPILGWVKLLQTREFDSEGIKKALTTIERNARLQTQLIDDLLDVSRILRGKLNLNMSPVNLVTVIEGAMETVRLAAEAKEIQIRTILDRSVGKVLGDSGRLQQVIWNLLSNAVKFTASGGQLDIRLECIDTQAQITVTDTGKGINPDFLPYVFDYFRQADSSTTRKFGGLGLGLAIVRHLVELHGGTVWAESSGEEKGSTFTVRIPLIKKELTSTTNNNPSVSDSLQKDRILTGIRILVVDDEVDTRDFYIFVLEQAGASVIAAASAKEALQVLAETELDILLSDIGMPEMDGYMLMRQVKAWQTAHNKQIRAIALTAYAGEVNEQQALKAGFQKHISKPVDPQELVRVVAALID